MSSSSLTSFIYRCQFIDHTLSVVEHGEIRLYDEGNIIVFHQSSSSSYTSSNLLNDDVANKSESTSGLQHHHPPKSLQDLHTIITFPSSSANSLPDSQSLEVITPSAHQHQIAARSRSASPSAASTSTSIPSSTTMIIFCFYKGDGSPSDTNNNLDVGVVLESEHDVKVIASKLNSTASRTSNKQQQQQSSRSTSQSSKSSLVWMKYENVEQVVRFLRLRYDQSSVLQRPIPFPHTRLDFLRLASNRSVQVKLASLGDNKLELSCDGVHVAGWLLNIPNSSGDDESKEEFQNITFRECVYDVLQLQQQQQDFVANSTTTTVTNNNHNTNTGGNAALRYFQARRVPTSVVLLSDEAVYATENTGRVRGRLPFADITELVSIPECSALYIGSGHGTFGTVIVSRFCPDIFSRIAVTYGAKLQATVCVPVTTSLSAISGDLLLTSAIENNEHTQQNANPNSATTTTAISTSSAAVMSKLQSLADSIERPPRPMYIQNNNNNLSLLSSPRQHQQQQQSSSATIAVNLNKNTSYLSSPRQQQQPQDINNSFYSPTVTMIVSTCDFATQTEYDNYSNNLLPFSSSSFHEGDESESVERRRQQNDFLLSPPPLRYKDLLDLASEGQQNADEDRTTTSPPPSLQDYYYAVAMYWQNQSKRLQECLARREVTLKMQQQRYDSLLASVHSNNKNDQNMNNNKRRASTTTLSSANNNNLNTSTLSENVVPSTNNNQMQQQREVEVLRHYSRLLEEELMELKGAELQERIIDLSSQVLPPTLLSAENNNNTENNVKALRLALLDSKRQQTTLTRKCNRLQAELQSVMINTDEALKEITSFAAQCLNEEHDDSVAADNNINNNNNASMTSTQREAEHSRRRRRNRYDIATIVGNAVTSLEDLESKVQTESAIKSAELKALNASLVVELRSREQEIETIAHELHLGNNNNNSMNNVSPRTRNHLLNNVLSSSTASTSTMMGHHHPAHLAEAVAQQSLDARQRSLARHITDLQLLKERLADELGHMLAAAAQHAHLAALQRRIDVLGRLHHVPLLVAKVAALEAVARESEECKLQARTMRGELDDKTAQLARRSQHFAAMQAELEAARRRQQQTQHSLSKEVARREEIERRVEDAAAVSENSIKELRKQVRYHQLRVQELLKRVATNNTNNNNNNYNGADTSFASETDEASAFLMLNSTTTTTTKPARNVLEQQKENITSTSLPSNNNNIKLSVKKNANASPPQTVSVAATSSLKAPSSSNKTGSGILRTSTPTNKNNNNNSTKHVTIQAKNKTNDDSFTSSNNNNELEQRTTTPPRVQPRKRIVVVEESSPENFGVVEDPVQVARTRFSEISNKSATTSTGGSIKAGMRSPVATTIRKTTVLKK